MSRRVRNWTIRFNIDSSNILQQYKSLLRKMREAERQSLGASPWGGSGRGRGGRRQNAGAPFSRIGTTIGGGDTLSIGIERSIARLRNLNLPLDQFNALHSRLGDINRRLNMAQSRREVIRLRYEFRDVEGEIRRIVRAQNQLNNQLTRSARLSRAFSASLGRAGKSLASLYLIGRVGSTVYRVGRDMDAMRASLMAASASAAEADQNFDFLKSTANELGRDLQGSLTGFNRIGVAARGAGFDTKQARSFFLAASEAATAFSLDTQRTNLVMLAMSQMLSKNKISQEEMGRQMAENVPVVWEAAEMATGKTTGEIMKMMANGKLMAKDFMVPFTNALRELARRNDALLTGQQKLIANQNRMNNSWKELVDDIFQSEGTTTFSRAFKFIADIIKDVSPFVKESVDIFFKLFRVVIDIVDGLLDILRWAASFEVISRTFRMIWDSIRIAVYSVLWVFHKISSLLYQLNDWRPSEWLSGVFDFGGDDSDGPSRRQRKSYYTPVSQMPTPVVTKSTAFDIGKIEINTSTNDPEKLAEEFKNAIIYDLSTGG